MLNITIQMNFIYRSVKTRSEADVNIPDFEIVVFGVGMMYPEVKQKNFLVDEKISNCQIVCALLRISIPSS